MITYNNKQKINDASSATQVGIFVSIFSLICNVLFRILMGHKFKEQTLNFYLSNLKGMFNFRTWTYAFFTRGFRLVTIYFGDL